MPSNTLQAVQRRIEQGVNLVETAKTYLMEESIKYEHVHVDYFIRFGLLVMMLDTIIIEMNSLRDDI